MQNVPSVCDLRTFCRYERAGTDGWIEKENLVCRRDPAGNASIYNMEKEVSMRQ